MGKENNRWEKLNTLFKPLNEKISTKIKNNQFLKFNDLLRLKNFKGGNSQFFENEEIINKKLEFYSKILFNFKRINKNEIIEKTFELIKNNKTKIEGFGNSFATTLLSLSYIEDFPIMDRKVLIGTEIIKTDKNIFIYKTIKNKNIYTIMDKYGIELYKDLCKKFDEIKSKKSDQTLRSLDKKYFNLGTKILNK